MSKVWILGWCLMPMCFWGLETTRCNEPPRVHRLCLVAACEKYCHVSALFRASLGRRKITSRDGWFLLKFSLYSIETQLQLPRTQLPPHWRLAKLQAQLYAPLNPSGIAMASPHDAWHYECDTSLVKRKRERQIRKTLHTTLCEMFLGATHPPPHKTSVLRP